jgi:hypothetical protein
MPVEVRDNIYSDIASQFPAVYRENNEVFVEFIEAYYKHLDEKITRDVPKIGDIDKTLNSFLVYYKKKYLSGLPFEPSVDVRFILKHIKDFYVRKGTEESLQLLFRMFFNENIEIQYPSRNIFRPSDSLWGGEQFLEMKSVFDVGGYPIRRGNTIRGDLSSASAFVDDIVFVNISGSVTPIVYMSNLKGKFTVNDSLEVISADNENVETIVNVGKLINGSISSIEVSNANRLPSNRVGDEVLLASRKNGLGATGTIAEVSSESIGSIDYEIVDGGFGYIKPGTLQFSLTDEYFNDIAVSNRVIVLHNDQVLDIKGGDTIIFPGSTVDHDNRVANGVHYSVTGAARVVDYRHPMLFIETRSLRDDVFDYLTDTYTNANGQVRNVLYDNYFNALAKFNNNAASRVFQVPPEKSDQVKEIYNKLPDDNGNILGNFTGDSQDGDLSQPSVKVNDRDFEIVFKFLQSVNNGIQDAELINNVETINAIIRTGGDIPPLSGTGVVNNTLLQAETADRMPTIAPVPAGPGGNGSANDTLGLSGFMNLSLGDLENGQFYTIVHPGTTLTEADWNLIGAEKGMIGTDFKFADADLHFVTIEGQTPASVTPTTLARHDAVFANNKQILARLYRWLSFNSILPQLTIGASLETPPLYPDLVSAEFPADDIATGLPLADGMAHPRRRTPNYEQYDAYHIPLAPTNYSSDGFSTSIKCNLVTGKEYVLFDLGTTSYAEWISLGLPLNTDATLRVNALSGAAAASALTARRTYFIHDLGEMSPVDWSKLGWSGADSDSTPQVGDRFIGAYPVPAMPVITQQFDGLNVFGTVRPSDTTLNHSINIADHGFESQDKVTLTKGTGQIGLVGGVQTLDDGVYFIKKLDNDHIQLYTSYELFDNNLVRYQDENVQTGPHNLVKTYGTPKAVDPHALLQHNKKFTALEPTEEITGTGIVLDHLKVNDQVSSPITYLTTDANTGQVVAETSNIKLGTYNMEGMMTDPVMAGSQERDRLPSTGLGNNVSFIGLINGKPDQTVRCMNIGAFNDSSSFEINKVDNEETVTIITDLLSDIALDTISIQDSSGADIFRDGVYDLSGPGLETANTEYRDAFNKVTFTLGSIAELTEDRPGTDYENDVGVRVVNDVIARFNKQDYIVNFDSSDFTLSPGEIVTQERILESSDVNYSLQYTPEQIAAIPASVAVANSQITYSLSATTFELVDETYEVRAEFVRREEEDFYFRHMSFHEFDQTLPVNIRAQDRNIMALKRDRESLPMGANANVIGPAYYDTGQITELAVSHTGYKFEDGEVVDIINTMPESPRYNKVIGSAQLRVLGQGKTLGRWKSKNSFASEISARIPDNDYYQEYSYDISSMIDPEIYGPLVKDVVGVSGTKMFSTPLINSNNTLESNVDAVITRFELLKDILKSESTVTGLNGQIDTVNGNIENKDLILDGPGVNDDADQDNDQRYIAVTVEKVQE